MPSEPQRDMVSPTSIFVGRERELVWIEREVSRREMRHGGAILITGPAGIGKTALVHRFLSGQRVPAKWFQADEFTRESNSQSIRDISDRLAQDRGEEMHVVLDGADGFMAICEKACQ
jgi:AAA+ ATPase superfamily predicted ATPase